MVSTRSLAFSIAAVGTVIFLTDADASKIRGADAYEIAFADPGNGNGRGNGKGPKGDRGPEYVRDDIRFGGSERDIVRDYYSKDCPPGLAKKNNGCLPPGQAKKRYEIGSRLPAGYDGDEVPYDLYRRLPPLRDGYQYRLLDGDLGIVELSTLIVLDAIGLY